MSDMPEVPEVPGVPEPETDNYYSDYPYTGVKEEPTRKQVAVSDMTKFTVAVALTL